MKVFVTGGSGYVGQVVLKHLLEAGHHVIALERPNTERPIRLPEVEVISGDLFDAKSLNTGVQGVDAVIHLVGIIREVPKMGITMKRIHVEGTRLVLDAAKQAGVSQFLHMSALGAKEHTTSAYHRSKWEAEQLVRQSGLLHTIFQPSIIFGRGGPGPEFVGQLVDLVSKAPFIPVIGHGQYRLQPVSVQTVAEAFTRALRSASTESGTSQTYEIGGPTVLTYAEILKQIADKLDKPFRTMRVPMVLMSMLVPLLERVPTFPITSDQLTMLREGNVCRNTNLVYRALSLEPIPFEILL